MRVLDLFAGLCGWSAPFAARGHDVFSIDLDERFDVSSHADILTLTPDDLPWRPDIILASPPCESFSVLRIGRNWHYDQSPTGSFAQRRPKTASAEIGLALVGATLRLIDELRPSYWVIENPRAALRKMPLMTGLDRRTVTYCQYGHPTMKPTDLWGGFPMSLTFRPMCSPNAACHIPAPRGSRTGIQSDSKSRKDPRWEAFAALVGHSVTDPALRAIVPAELALDVCLAAERDGGAAPIPTTLWAVGVRFLCVLLLVGLVATPLRLTATTTPERFGTIPLDLAFGDGPCFADEAGAQLSLADLTAQRGRRHPEKGCRLSEREHGSAGTSGVDRLGVLSVLVAAPSAASGMAGGARLRGRGLRGFHLGDQFLRQSGHRVLLGGAVHVQNLHDNVYVVNRVVTGQATWYCSATSACTRGYSPSDLVAAIDPSTGFHKGDQLRVRSGGKSVVVTIVDVCLCRGERVIDLTSGAFRRLAPLSRGVIPVSLELVGGIDVPLTGVPTAPPTNVGP